MSRRENPAGCHDDWQERSICELTKRHISRARRNMTYSLPASVIGSDSLSAYKSRLKTFLFRSTHNRLPPAPLKLRPLQICCIIIIIIWPGVNPWWLKNYKSWQRFVWWCTLLWPVIINKTIVQQNRIKSLHHNGNPLKQKRRCSNIPGRLRQSPAQLAQELKSIPVDWAVGLHRNRDEFTQWCESSILNHLVRCRQLGCSACLARWSFQVRVGSGARHRDIPYERPARAPRNQCQSIWAFSVGTAKARWLLGHRDAGWGKRSCYDAIIIIIIIRHDKLYPAYPVTRSTNHAVWIHVFDLLCVTSLHSRSRANWIWTKLRLEMLT